MPITFKVSKEEQKVKLPNRGDYVERKNLAYKLGIEGDIIATSENLNGYGSIISENSFGHAIRQAYSDENNLVLTPDNVWLAIITQFCFYVDANGEKLRDRFVNFDGQEMVIVERTDTMATADYNSIIQEFSDKIAKRIKSEDIRNWIIPNFSTTTLSERMAGTIALMAITKSYFKMLLTFRCGLANVTLEGTVEDWKNIRARANRLLEFDCDGQLTKWSSLLFPVLDKLVKTAEGSPDVDWWSKICREQRTSGGTYVDGWVTTFHVFDKNGKWILGEDGFINGDILSPGSFQVKFTIDDRGTEYNATFFAGHFIHEKINDCTIKPGVGWILAA
jgi:hypothetical protein